MTATLSICAWDNFQHYKDRDPPWIKLYRDLLTSESWVLGTDNSRLLQVASLLLAARYKNEIPMQWGLIRKVASLDFSEKEFNAAVSHLISTKFFEIKSLPDQPGAIEQSASNVLATCTSETEQSRAETEQRERARERATRLPDDFELTPERRLVAEAETLPAERTFAKFRDHWRSASGQKARKVDWDAAWRNWCRTEYDRGGNSGNGRPSSAPRPSAVERVRRATQQWLDDDQGASGGGMVIDG
jgi:hypothetical protein